MTINQLSYHIILLHMGLKRNQINIIYLSLILLLLPSFHQQEAPF
jgi:hypothetical protein